MDLDFNGCSQEMDLHRNPYPTKKISDQTFQRINNDLNFRLRNIISFNLWLGGDKEFIGSLAQRNDMNPLRKKNL